MEKLFNRICEYGKIASVSGYEEEIQKCFKSILTNNTIATDTDVMGNVYGILNVDSKLTCMIDSHCDEIGGIVRYIDDNGFIFFSKIGGVDFDQLSGHKIQITTQKKTKINGIICKKKIDYDEDDINSQKIVKSNEIYIDIGAQSKKETNNIVNIGDPISFYPNVSRLENNIISAKGLDDKVGLAVITEVLIKLSNSNPNINTIGVSTVQEEVGLRGAKVCANKMKPDISFSIDVMETTDYPFTKKEKTGDIKIGNGPIIYRGPNIHPKLSSLLVTVAENNSIPYQLLGLSSTSDTNAGAIQIAGKGTASALIDIPLRYMHTPSEIVSLNDVLNTIELVYKVILSFNDDFDLTPF